MSGVYKQDRQLHYLEETISICKENFEVVNYFLFKNPPLYFVLLLSVISASIKNVFSHQALCPDRSPNSTRWWRPEWTSLAWTSLMDHMKYVFVSRGLSHAVSSYFTHHSSPSPIDFHSVCPVPVPRGDHQKHPGGGRDADLRPPLLSAYCHRLGHKRSGDPHWISQRGKHVTYFTSWSVWRLLSSHWQDRTVVRWKYCIVIIIRQRFLCVSITHSASAESCFSLL